MWHRVILQKQLPSEASFNRSCDSWICMRFSLVSDATIKTCMTTNDAVGRNQFSYANTCSIKIGSLIERTIIKQTVLHHYWC